MTGASRPGARIVVTSERDDLNSELEITFTNSPGWASVTARRKNESFWSHGLSVHFEIEVPTETRTEIHTGGGASTFPACVGQPMRKRREGQSRLPG